MLYYLFRFLEQFGVPGSGMWSYISFRSLLALMLALIVSAWFGQYFIRWMKRHNVSEVQRDAKIDPFGVKKIGVPSMGGIIIIDFIDMAKAEHRQALYDHMREVMQKDRARHNILPLSKFGLMQITRQRVRPALDIVTAETCPSCGGKGEIQPSLLFTDMLKDKISYLVNDLHVDRFTMYVHPFVEAYLKKGIISEYFKWRREFGRKFKILPDQSLAYLQYKVLDKNHNEIDLKEEKDTSSSQSKKERRSKNQRNLDN